MLESPEMVPRTKTAYQLYLASNSPRRKELFSLLGLEYDLLPTWVDETPYLGEDGVDYVKRTARSKAVAAASRAIADAVLIAADTAVIDHPGSEQTEIMGKPNNPMEATEMLRRLRGHTHQVFTAITIIHSRSGTILSDLCTTDVPMRNYSDEEIRAYVASGDPMDKAGAYAIQNAAFHPVEALVGCYANVMGLPLCHLVRNLSQLNITSDKNVPQACQDTIGYDCPVYHLILSANTTDLPIS